MQLPPDPARPLTQWANFNTAQVEYLDAVRGLAAQIVLVQHAAMLCFRDVPGQIGNLGVVLFFLLSGFLITDTVRGRVQAGRFTLTEFMVSRATRIYMPYVPALLLTSVLDSIAVRSPDYVWRADFNLRTALGNLAMLQDFSVFQLLRRLGVPEQPWFIREFGSARQFWTISIEWWIYVCVGLAVALALGVRRRHWLIALLCFAAIEPLYNLVAGPGNTLTGYWLLGALGSVIYRRAPAIPLGPIALAAAALTVLRLLYTHWTVFDVVFVAGLGTLLWLPLLALRHRSGHMPLHRARLHRSAFHSYSLYLTHAPLLTCVALLAHGDLTGWRGMVVCVLAANVVALPFALAFERPQKRVRAWLLGRLQPRARVGLMRLGRPFPRAHPGTPP